MYGSTALNHAVVLQKHVIANSINGRSSALLVTIAVQQRLFLAGLKLVLVLLGGHTVRLFNFKASRWRFRLWL
jgi:hypothetical protein